MVALVLVCCMIFAALPIANATAAENTANNENNWNNPFTDVAANSWYYDAVRYVNDNNIMLGATADLFQPNTAASRAMVVTILWRLAGSPTPEGVSPFTDLTANAYYINAITWANANQIVNGVDATHFNPNQPISREQMVSIIYRYAKMQKMDVSKTDDLSAYSDINKISKYAVPAIGWAKATGLIKGKTAQSFAPQDSLTRAEAATMFMRYQQNTAK